MIREELIKSTEYWLVHAQFELFRQLTKYMKRNNLTQDEVADKFGFTKRYVSQILNGNFNHSLRKLIELSLAIGLAPKFAYEPMDKLIEKDRKKRPAAYPKRNGAVRTPRRTGVDLPLLRNRRHN